MVPTFLQITNLGPPIFESTLKEQVMAVDTYLTYELPNIQDPDDDDFVITCKFGQAAVFARINYPYLYLEPNSKNNGTFSITLTLKDTNINPKLSIYTLPIRVLSNEEASQYFNWTDSKNNGIIKTGVSTSLTAKINYMDAYGKFRV